VTGLGSTHDRLTYATRVVVAALFASPLLLLVVGALRGSELPATTVELFPTDATLANLRRVFDVVPLARYAVNSAIVCAVAVPLSVAIASATGYAIARLPRRGGAFLVVVALVASIVPSTALHVGRFWAYRAAGITDGVLPLILPALVGTSALFVLVYAVAFRRVPTELFDTAASLGASPFETWRRVALPNVRVVTAAVVALTFAFTWGNAADALVLVTDERWFTLPAALATLAIAPATEQPVMLAGALLAVVPVMVVVIGAQWWARAR
jgi:multiple sugar transport system permease protein